MLEIFSNENVIFIWIPILMAVFLSIWIIASNFVFRDEGKIPNFKYNFVEKFTFVNLLYQYNKRYFGWLLFFKLFEMFVFVPLFFVPHILYWTLYSNGTIFTAQIKNYQLAIATVVFIIVFMLVFSSLIFEIYRTNKINKIFLRDRTKLINLRNNEIDNIKAKIDLKNISIREATDNVDKSRYLTTLKKYAFRRIRRIEKSKNIENKYFLIFQIVNYFEKSLYSKYLIQNSYSETDIYSFYLVVLNKLNI
ncbi:hypothetical protein EI74_0301 [Mycoplasma testudineum]|uniref:Uncharacterized protein n=2 Tax=Mycoplasma testudineum TaxID=244584 RepID=A0A4R6IDX2_9MOLU|nr:hypothetical protein CG473_01115 [Mycoplasma testudineum]TDO20473.1 hypothetical protein EI74_0301 [Mycoplasma testudineum]